MRNTAIRTLLTSVFLSLLCVSLALAQDQTVSGTVTDGVTGQPLPGANVSVKGTTTGTTTDMQGSYELTVPGSDAVLVFSFVGYQQQEITVGDQSTINVTLQEDVEQLDEVVVVGYGTQRRSEVSGAVSSVDVAEANVGQTTSPEDLIRGRVAGVNIQDNNGEPGGGVNVRIRGTTSISAGSDPLYVIDGVPINNTSTVPGGAEASGVTASSSSNPLALLNPNDIESIEILKDAAATAIYGSQGANGVILVTTKGGSSGEVQVDYSARASTSALANPLDLLTGSEYVAATREFLGDDSANQLGGANTDWQDEVYRRAYTQNHNLSFSGGTEQTTYRASIGYLDQQGIVLTSGLERLSGRINADHKVLNDRVRFNLNLTGAFTEREHTFYGQGGGFEGGTLKGAIGFNPTLPVRENGEFTTFSNSIFNPVGIEEQTDDNTDQTRILGNFSTEVDITESLTAKGLLGVDRSTSLRRTYIPRASELSPDIGAARQAERELNSIVTQATLRYNRDVFDDHSIQLLGGYEYKLETFKEVGTSVTQFVTDQLSFNNLTAGAEVNKPFSENLEAEQVSGFARVNYNIAGKYLLEATTRVDGSSVFGDNNKYGVFPSGSAAWNIAQESFMEDVSWLTQLKLRVSYGLSGNQAVAPLQSLQLLRPNEDFIGIFGNEEELVGFAQSNLANPDLKWETTSTANVGVDFTAGRFDGSVEVYRKTTNDLLVVLPLPQPAVVGERLENAGEVRNTGVEASLETFVIDRPDLGLNFGLNVASNRNIVQDLGELEEVITTPAQGRGQTGTNTQIIREGSPIGTFYGPEFVGIENGVQLYRTADGGTTSDVNQAERRIIGNAVPDFTYGFNTRFRYKSFDANVFLRGSYGGEVFNNTALEFATKANLSQQFNLIESALSDGISVENSTPVYSSRWIEDASFLRIDNVTIGYNLSTPETLGLRRARVYVSGQNLWVFTSYDGYDPEVNSTVNDPILNTTAFRALSRPNRGVDYTNYPRARTFTIGVEVGL